MFEKRMTIEKLLSRGKSALKVFADTRAELVDVNSQITQEIVIRKREVEQLEDAFKVNDKVVNKINEFLED